MAWTTESAFSEFFDAINLPGDHRNIANARKDHVISLLGKQLTVVEAFPTGSIPRFTALEEHADLDIIATLHYGKHIKDRKPSAVLLSVREALADYVTSLRRNGQAVTLQFKTWPHVDIVPAAQVIAADGSVTSYLIPDMHREVWLTSDPKRHAATLDTRSGACGPNFRKVIKMFKHWSRRNGDLLQSYHIEAMALATFNALMTDITWDAHAFFDSVTKLLAFPLAYQGQTVDTYLQPLDRSKALANVSAANSTSLLAWHATYGTNSNHNEAVTLWRRIYGQLFPTYG
jgi:hypothetical protein